MLVTPGDNAVLHIAIWLGWGQTETLELLLSGIRLPPKVAIWKPLNIVIVITSNTNNDD